MPDSTDHSPFENDQDTLVGGLSLAAGMRIGPYKLLEQIGEGGFGVVWVAEQREPVKQRVALKVIKVGMDTKQVIARFEAERQALAMMNHPNIAKVLGAGSTETGRPYFCLELIRGIPITQYCDERKLSIRARLELYIRVCRAIQHAHQKGIIHRDIKPSNILVAMHDGEPVPKVIDFGIAKATHQDLTDKTIYTQAQQFIGTPTYMSPEQAGVSDLDIDTRSDVYSLGVLLYELLTGNIPFEPSSIQAGFDEMRQVIRERDPQRPSTRVATLGRDEQTTVAGRRSTASARLVSTLRGDLDWIVMKALEKDRSRRYETANGLAEDILRHLRDEPVSAAAPSAMYQLFKLAKRYRGAFLTASAVTVVLVLGMVATGWQARIARREAENAAAVTRFLTEDLLGEADPMLRPVSGLTLLDAIDLAAPKIGKNFQDQPLIEAALRTRIGKAYWLHGRTLEGEEFLKRALQLYQLELGDHAEEAVAVAAELCKLYKKRGIRHAQKNELANKYLPIAEKTLGESHPITLELMGTARGKGPTAALELDMRRLRISRAHNPPDHRTTLDALVSIAELHLSMKKPELARPYLQEVLQLAPQSVQAVEAHWQIGRVQRNASDYEQAQASLTAAVDLAESYLGRRHALSASALIDLARVLVRRGKADEAWVRFKQLQKLVQEDTSFVSDFPDLPWKLRELSMEMATDGRYDDAITMGEQALNWNPNDQVTYHRVAPFYLKVGRRADYERHAKEMLGKFSGTQGWQLEQVLKTCFLVPVEYGNRDRELLDTLRARLSNEAGGLNGWNGLAVTLAHYRNGEFSDAARTVGQTVTPRGSQRHFGGLLFDMQHHVLQALTSLRRGKEEDARQFLGLAEKAWQKADRHDFANRGIGADDLVRYEVLREEVKALLPGQPPSRE